METAFRALADSNRRHLLDRLAEADGQTLEEMCAHVPTMTRFGVMKHLKVLEAAGLVVTRRAGREKLHYLNPLPIRLIHDRWIDKYAEPWARALSNLKRDLEGGTMQKPRHVYELFIRATPEQLWAALTDPALTRRYFYGGSVESTWQVGAPFKYSMPDGSVAYDGTVLECDSPRRLVHTFENFGMGGSPQDRPTRVTWEITPAGEACKLTLVHDDFEGETATYHSVGGGWPFILSNLKTLLETGEPLNVG